MTEHKTMKVWTDTLRVLRMIAALTGKPMVKILDELARRELDKLVKKEGAKK